LSVDDSGLVESAAGPDPGRREDFQHASPGAQASSLSASPTRGARMLFRSAASDAGLAQRMQRSIGRRMVLLLVLAVAIGGACVTKAGEVDARAERPRAAGSTR
jgi:hypothetical protein